MSLIPIVEPSGHIRSRVSRFEAEQMKGVRQVRNGKGRVIRILVAEESPMVKELVRLGRPSNYGLQFVQHLRIGGAEFDEQRPVGLRWLHGVRGS